MAYKDTLNFVVSIVDSKKSTIEQGQEKVKEELSLIIEDINSVLAPISTTNTLEEFYEALKNLKVKHIEILERENEDYIGFFILHILNTDIEITISHKRLEFLDVKKDFLENLLRVKEQFRKLIENYIEIRSLFVLRFLLEDEISRLYSLDLGKYLNLKSLMTKIFQF